MLLLSLLVLAGARADSPRCATPEVLTALARGARIPSWTEPPPGLGLPASSPPGAGKQIYGSPYAFHHETRNFSINWSDGSLPEAAAVSAGEALEAAWTAFLDDQGWPAPVSSDRYYLWVLLDPGLGGTTGYTTVYMSEEFPGGYPVMFLNPDWAGEEAFWASLSAHEFMHAIQYGMRDWSGTVEGEAWYWEASATWGSELAQPEVDGHQYTSAWYAEQPELRFDSMVGSHQYGIFVFNAWLEEALTGPGGMRAAWELSASRAGAPWDGILEEATGVDPGNLWAGFTGAYGNAALAESELYTPPALVGALVEGTEGTLPYLGTHYYEVAEAGTVTVEGPAILGGALGSGVALELAPGERLAVTGLQDDAAYRLGFVPTGASGDGGALGGEDSGEDPGEPGDEARAGCGCGGAGAPVPWSAALALAGLAARRRGRGARASTTRFPGLPSGACRP